MTGLAMTPVAPAKAGFHHDKAHFADPRTVEAAASHVHSQPDVGARRLGHDVAADAIELHA